MTAPACTELPQIFIAHRPARLVEENFESVSWKDYTAICQRVKALPEGHNLVIDFLSDLSAMQDNDQRHGVSRLKNFHLRLFSRIEELEDIHSQTKGGK
ncbi:MAG: hypothetical protein CSB47_10420 [Proteobacteria bacterium]|nr:MAG: hypothetical protein CSB47_10420 [Pseudomonadota bacterium]